MKTYKNIELSVSYCRFMFPIVLAMTVTGCSDFGFIDLEPSGPIMRTIDELFWITIALMSLVLIPVFVMTVWFIWKYRSSNSQAPYAPDWNRSIRLEWLVWQVAAHYR